MWAHAASAVSDGGLTPTYPASSRWCSGRPLQNRAAAPAAHGAPGGQGRETHAFLSGTVGKESVFLWGLLSVQKRNLELLETTWLSRRGDLV